MPPFFCPLVQEPWSLLALRFVHGFATAIFSPVASAYVASLAETGRGARLGWFPSANDIGVVLYFTTSYSLVTSKQELKNRLMAAVDYFNDDPVVHTWTYKLDKAA
jgi:MFS family permease